MTAPSACDQGGIMRYVFARFRYGKRMAEGITVHAESADKAVHKALSMRDGDHETIELLRTELP